MARAKEKVALLDVPRAKERGSSPGWPHRLAHLRATAALAAQPQSGCHLTRTLSHRRGPAAAVPGAHVPVALQSSEISIGLGLRRAFADPLLARLAAGDAAVDWLELIPENFIGRGGRARAHLERACHAVPVHAHGVSLNVGGPEPLQSEHLDAMGRFLDRIGAQEWSEHLCFTAAGGHHFHELLPLPMCDETVAHVAARVRTAARVTGRPLLLENIASYARMPGSTLDEGAFVRSVLDESGAKLLLDVNNVFVTARNAGIAPEFLLDSLPLERTGQIHVAGNKQRAGLFVDSHDRAVAPEVHALLARALRRTGPVPVMLEWDLCIPSLDDVLAELDAVRTTAVNAVNALDALPAPSASVLAPFIGRARRRVRSQAPQRAAAASGAACPQT